jgi:membrane-associated PAP2 superfamily phosphatase
VLIKYEKKPSYMRFEVFTVVNIKIIRSYEELTDLCETEQSYSNGDKCPAERHVSEVTFAAVAFVLKMWTLRPHSAQTALFICLSRGIIMPGS